MIPSMNIPRYETALLYPGTCLLEGTNCSEGRGTSDPFGMIGAPFVRAEALCREFNDLNCPGVAATPIYFTPTTSKHQGVLCGGIHLHILDEQALRPVELGIRLITLLKDMYPEEFRFLPISQEWGEPFISLLAGHREFEKPNWDADALVNRSDREAMVFRERKLPYEIYPW